MNLRWLLFDYADPSLPLSFRQRAKIQLRRVPMRDLPNSIVRRRILCAVVTVIPMIVTIILKQYLIFQLTVSNQMNMWLILAMYAVFIILSWIWICITYGIFLRSEYYFRMRLEGFDVCLGCGYWLRGLDGTIKACPECGTERLACDEDKQTKAES